MTLLHAIRRYLTYPAARRRARAHLAASVAPAPVPFTLTPAGRAAAVGEGHR